MEPLAGLNSVKPQSLACSLQVRLVFSTSFFLSFCANFKLNSSLQLLLLYLRDPTSLVDCCSVISSFGLSQYIKLEKRENIMLLGTDAKLLQCSKNYAQIFRVHQLHNTSRLGNDVLLTCLQNSLTISHVCQILLTLCL